MTENNSCLKVFFTLLNIFYIYTYINLPNILKKHTLCFLVLCIFSLNSYLILYNFILNYKLAGYSINFFYYLELIFFTIDLIFHFYVAFHFPFFVDMSNSILFKLFGNHTIYISFVMISVQTYALIIFSFMFVTVSISYRLYKKQFLKNHNITHRAIIINFMKKIPNILPNKEQTCIICLEDGIESENDSLEILDLEKCNWKKLNCDHTFHTQCLEEWFLINMSCPICRQESSI